MNTVLPLRFLLSLPPLLLLLLLSLLLSSSRKEFIVLGGEIAIFLDYSQFDHHLVVILLSILLYSLPLSDSK